MSTAKLKQLDECSDVETNTIKNNTKRANKEKEKKYTQLLKLHIKTSCKYHVYLVFDVEK